MGLLDNFYFCQSAKFGGDAGGLLDFLRNSQMQQSQYQPSQGFPQGDTFASRFDALPGAPQAFAPSGRQFDAATFDHSNYAPNQAQPIAVGKYQMPRMGGAEQYAGAPNAIPSQ